MLALRLHGNVATGIGAVVGAVVVCASAQPVTGKGQQRRPLISPPSEVDFARDLFIDPELLLAQRGGQDTSGEAVEDQILVISASRRPQRIELAPAIISVISERQIRTAGYRSVAEALENVPGLAINTDHVFHNVGLRGISGGIRGGSRHLKLLINGHPVAFRSDAQNFLGPELIPIHAVKRIEVIRGPASSVYGVNAFLGVVNVITKTASSGAHALAAGEIGTIKEGISGGTELFAQVWQRQSPGSGGAGHLSQTDRAGAPPAQQLAQFLTTTTSCRPPTTLDATTRFMGLRRMTGARWAP